jgi:hypothetical protein
VSSISRTSKWRSEWPINITECPLNCWYIAHTAWVFIFHSVAPVRTFKGVIVIKTTVYEIFNLLCGLLNDLLWRAVQSTDHGNQQPRASQTVPHGNHPAICEGQIKIKCHGLVQKGCGRDNFFFSNEPLPVANDDAYESYPT